MNPAKPTVGRTGIQRLADTAEAVKLIAEASICGATCIWIRNAVDDAIAAVDLLRAAAVDAELLHGCG